MSKITVQQDFLVGGLFQRITVDVSQDGCLVTLSPSNIHSISWAQLDDIERLSEVFADETVRTFKVIVQMLGKIYVKRELYKGVV